MSQASVEIVKEFFAANRFFVLGDEDILFIRNSLARESAGSPGFVIPSDEITLIKNGVVKVISWHTMKFTPAVLNKNPEIFDFVAGSYRHIVKKTFMEENFSRILVIPALPSSENLRIDSIKIMKEKGIDGVITFPSLIAGLIDKIEARQVYLSSVNEVLRILKFYRFFVEKEQILPF